MKHFLRLFALFVSLLSFSGCWVGAGVAINELNSSDSSNVPSIGVPPTAFNLLTPIDTGAPQALNPTFIWENTTNETGYVLEVSTDVAFTEPILYQTPTIPANITLHTLPVGMLNDGQTYYWRVVASGGGTEVEAANGPFSFTPTVVTYWSKMLGGAWTESSIDFIETSDGGFATVQTTASFGVGGNDVLVIRFNPDKSIAWQKTYGGPDSDIAKRLIETQEGGFLVGASTGSFGTGGGWLIKLNSDGKIEWEKVYEGGSINDLVQLPGGGYMGVGSTGTSPNLEAWVVTISSTGALLTQKSYSVPWEAWILVSTMDGGFIVVGRRRDVILMTADVWVMKLAADLSIEWERAVGGPDDELATGIVERPGGGYVLTGNHETAPDVWVGWLVQLNTTGGLVSSDRLVVPGGNGGPEEILNTSDGGYLTAGRIWNGVDSFTWIQKRDSGGIEEWQKLFEPNNIYHLAHSQTGGFLACGNTYKFGATVNDGWVAVVPADFNLPPLMSAVSYSYTPTPVTSTAVSSTETVTTFDSQNTMSMDEIQVLTTRQVP